LLAAGLEGLARVAVAMGRWDEAKALLNEAAQTREATARPAMPHEQVELDELLGPIGGGASEAVRLTPHSGVDKAP